MEGRILLRVTGFTQALNRGQREAPRMTRVEMADRIMALKDAIRAALEALDTQDTEKARAVLAGAVKENASKAHPGE